MFISQLLIAESLELFKDAAQYKIDSGHKKISAKRDLLRKFDAYIYNMNNDWRLLKEQVTHKNKSKSKVYESTNYQTMLINESPQSLRPTTTLKLQNSSRNIKNSSRKNKLNLTSKCEISSINLNSFETAPYWDGQDKVHLDYSIVFMFNGIWTDFVGCCY